MAVSRFVSSNSSFDELLEGAPVAEELLERPRQAPVAVREVGAQHVLDGPGRRLVDGRRLGDELLELAAHDVHVHRRGRRPGARAGRCAARARRRRGGPPARAPRATRRGPGPRGRGARRRCARPRRGPTRSRRRWAPAWVTGVGRGRIRASMSRILGAACDSCLSQPGQRPEIRPASLAVSSPPPSGSGPARPRSRGPMPGPAGGRSAGRWRPRRRREPTPVDPKAAAPRAPMERATSITRAVDGLPGVVGRPAPDGARAEQPDGPRRDPRRVMGEEPAAVRPAAAHEHAAAEHERAVAARGRRSPTTGRHSTVNPASRSSRAIASAIPAVEPLWLANATSTMGALMPVLPWRWSGCSADRRDAAEGRRAPIAGPACPPGPGRLGPGRPDVPSGPQRAAGGRLEHPARVEQVARIECPLDRRASRPRRPRRAAGRASRGAPTPIPCSPVTVPPSASAASYRSARAASSRGTAASPSSRSSTNVGWRLPSPAWPNVPTSQPVARRRSPRSRGASPGSGSAARPRPPSARRRGAPARGTPCAGPGAASRPPGRPGPGSTDVAPDASQTGTAVSSSCAGGDARQVRLDEQHRGGVAVEAQAVDVVDGADREPVHELERHRARARRPSSPATARPPRRATGRRRSASRAAAGAGRSRSVASVIRPERPLRPDEQRDQPVARDVLDVLAAQPEDRPVGHHDLEAEDRVARDAVLHAAQAARVRPEVAADRALLVAGGIRRVEQAVLGDGGLELAR